ncbi:MAG: single-stranded-DNA-specific exonuclease RecJ, partial [Flavobacteriales bacterium]|nr:single-stranded-DNA-specific exonuclease RecJ [Flavobacteriales bacterium]
GNNALRQELDRDITGQALEQVRDEAVSTGEATNVVYHPEWHKGVIGIVASRLVEMRYRPTVVLTDSNDKVAG